MKKNGFTLVELLAVIALLGMLIAIAIPAYSKLSTKTKNNLYKEKVESIETAAVLYAKDREDDLRGGDINTGLETGQGGDTSVAGDISGELVVQDDYGEKVSSIDGVNQVWRVQVWYLLQAGYLDNEGECADTPATESTKMVGGKEVNMGLGRKEYCDPRDNKSMRNKNIYLTRKVLQSGKVTYSAELQE